MLYSSPEFILLFLLTFAAFGLAARHAARFTILLAASLLFYAWAGLFDAAIFCFVVTISWLTVALARRFPGAKDRLIASGITVMSAHLFFWKYASWASAQVQIIFPDFLGGARLDLPLPVGISFFTLQGIAYLVDYGRGQADYMRWPMFLLYKSFFAQLVAGPIVRARQLLPQLQRLEGPSREDVSAGLGLFVMGFFKKFAVADRAALFVDAVFKAPQSFDRLTLIQAVLGYTVQIWADFSGYTDMGRGAARMLGIRLPENFLSPYLARAPSEFWRRWHVTLSEWIRDYVYIPLGGSRGAPLRVLAVVVATMTISGLWHGAEWHFLAWGLYHGALLVGERKLGVVLAEAGWARAAQTGGMFLLTAFGWLIFRAESLPALGAYLRAFGSGTASAAAPAHALSVWAGLFFCAAAHGLSDSGFLERFRERELSASAGLGAGLALAAVFVLALVLRPSGSKAFIYFQF